MENIVFVIIMNVFVYFIKLRDGVVNIFGQVSVNKIEKNKVNSGVNVMSVFICVVC